VPLEEARLSTFLAADKNATVDSEEALTQVFLSGSITDLQGRMNVLNLVEDGKVSLPWFKAFSRLFEQLGLPLSELATVTENLRFAQDNSPDNGSSLMASLLPQRVGQLRWLGLSDSSLVKLGEFITLLPVRTPVNLNTASVTVLRACIPTLDQAQAQRLATSRQTKHFGTFNDAGLVVPEISGELNHLQHSVNSLFFEVQGRLRLDQTVVQERSVVQREGLNVKTLWRDRGGQAPPITALQ
jgi:general secretion pathway protein K